MKKNLIVLLATVSFVACNTIDKKSDDGKNRDAFLKDSIAMAEKLKVMDDTANYTTLQWLDSTSMDLGTVKEGAPVEVSYRFTNTGDKPLVIANVTASCGCTVPEKPEEPIAPGKQGTIKAKFDSKGRKGTNNKVITVDANTKPSRTYELKFKVEVKE